MTEVIVPPMIASMTAFARQAGEYPWGSLVWEIRSVNHRYLEPSFKLPDPLRSLEGELREQLRSRISRGKIECNLRLQRSDDDAVQLVINQALAQQVIDAAQAVNRAIGDAAPIDPLAILQWPGVLGQTEIDADTLHRSILESFQRALRQLLEHRNREGAELASFIGQRLQSVTDITAAVRQQLPIILAAQNQKLSDRLNALRAELDPARLEQEIVLLTAKADVDEELDRLQTHVNEVQRVLDKGGPCGRRLDFLMQELNREANTLSSKSLVSDTTQAAVELKVLIEQMREQVQNIE